MTVFDIIGPVMVGPSSSHTAGAARIGHMARVLLGEEPEEAVITLYGSFAKTYRGHGTDRAIIGGLLGMPADDPRLRNSMQIAAEQGLAFRFVISEEKAGHPNAALLDLKGRNGSRISILGFSVGGGNIEIRRLNGMDVEFTGQYNTLIVLHRDIPGAIAAVTNIFGNRGINIAFMKVYRSQLRGESVMIIETEDKIDSQTVSLAGKAPGVLDVKLVEAAGIF